MPPESAPTDPTAHGTATVQFDTVRSRYAVRCICGWIGIPMPTSQAAWAAIDAHLADVRQVGATPSAS